MFHYTVSRIKVPGYGCTGAAVAIGHEVYAFPNLNRVSNYFDPIAVYVFNTVSLCWTKLSPVTIGKREFPSWRYDHTAVLVGDIVYIWGGNQPNRLYKYRDLCNGLYAFDVDAHTWSKPRVSGAEPGGRIHHSACVLENVMYIHGGITLGGHINDTSIYKLDTTTMVWTLINTRGTPPPATAGNSLTIIGTKMFVFGGFRWDPDERYNTISVFDTETNHWTVTPSTQPLPETRNDHSAFTYNGELYIFGGENKFPIDDVWKFNPDTFSWKEVKPKGNSPSRNGSRCCCIVGDRIILYEDCGLSILDLSPSLKTLCKLAVIQYDLDQSELPHNIRWELEAVEKNQIRKSKRKKIRR